MMRRIDLMPASYAERRKQRRAVGMVALAGLVVLAVLLAWWVFLGTQISTEEERLAEVQATNADLQAQIDELARFARLEQEVQQRQAALETAMTGDVDWPAVLTEIAMVVPGEVWLTSLQGSAVIPDGALVGTEDAEIDVAQAEPFGRVQFQGTSLSMPGIGKWMIRLGSVKDFQAVWLTSATENSAQIEQGIPATFDFDSTIEFNEKAASLRFQEGRP
ncbi:MAG: PilN domain-containing protein [Actinomycetota bacterium]|nr:PilN domain-containing protein [Actinomycetota bacterium]